MPYHRLFHEYKLRLIQLFPLSGLLWEVGGDELVVGYLQKVGEITNYLYIAIGDLAAGKSIDHIKPKSAYQTKPISTAWEYSCRCLKHYPWPSNSLLVSLWRRVPST